MSPSCSWHAMKSIRSIAALRAGAFALAACLFAAPALAQERAPEPNRFELTPLVGYMGGGEFEDPSDETDRDLEEDTNLGLIFNIMAEPWRHYEFLYTRMQSEVAGDLESDVEGEQPFDLDVEYLQLGGIVSHPDARYVIPYFGLTIGATRFSPDAADLDDETKFSFTAAAGVRIPIGEHVGVRLDARAFGTLLDSDGSIFCRSDEEGGSCRIRAKSDIFLQYAASLGFFVGF